VHTVRRTGVRATHLSLADSFSVIAGANATAISSSGFNYGTGHAYDRSDVQPLPRAVVDLAASTSAYAS
jgi:outer membrane receptor for ferric coprogen and ferric-rhodotorulic acid